MKFKVKEYLKQLAGITFVLATAFLLGACGSPAGTSSSNNGGGGGGGGTATGLISHGIDTTTKAHSTWIATAPHDSYTCNDCHSVSRDQVCAQSGCHPFSKYTTLATNFNHTTAGTGEQCNKCHGMTPEPTATDAVRIAGWRENMLISSTVWHTSLTGVCTDCHDPVTHNPMNTLSIFPVSHTTDVSRQSGCEACHYYKVNSAGSGGLWAGGHPAETSGCANATCHTHTTVTTQTHYQSGTAPAGQHYDANTSGPYNCEWCHAETIANNYTSWAVTFDKTTHQNWNSNACKACHVNGYHPAVTTGCRTATCHTHTVPTTQTHQDSGYEAGHHYDANAGGSMGAGPFECEWCHNTVAANGYTSWSLAFSKSGHRKGTTKWDIRSCGACHPNSIPN